MLDHVRPAGTVLHSVSYPLLTFITGTEQCTTVLNLSVTKVPGRRYRRCSSVVCPHRCLFTSHVRMTLRKLRMSLTSINLNVA